MGPRFDNQFVTSFIVLVVCHCINIDQFDDAFYDFQTHRKAPYRSYLVENTNFLFDSIYPKAHYHAASNLVPAASDTT